MPRIKVFLDHQNVYQDARRTFFSAVDPGTHGQFSPRRLGELLTVMRAEPPGRELTQVRVYTGRPSSSRDPKTYGAHMRQCARWAKDRDVVVVPRSIRYPRNWPSEPAQEKGIDVHLAVDLVRGYVADEFDIGIVASTDTDLLPAIEALFELDRRKGYEPVEVCAWQSGDNPKQLRMGARKLWCHPLERKQYNHVRDLTDYNIGPYQARRF